MKSDSHTSEKQKPQSVKQDDKRPPDKVRDAAWTFLKTLRQDDPTLVPAVESCDDQKRNGGSQIISTEQSGDRPPPNIPEATRSFIKKLRESGYERPVVEELGSDRSKVKNLNAAPQSSTTAAKKVHDVTQLFIEELRESGYERPNVGNQRTLAAHAMLKHVHAEHSRETHVRAMTMVMERQSTPR